MSTILAVHNSAACNGILGTVPSLYSGWDFPVTPSLIIGASFTSLIVMVTGCVCRLTRRVGGRDHDGVWLVPATSLAVQRDPRTYSDLAGGLVDAVITLVVVSTQRVGQYVARVSRGDRGAHPRTRR